MELVLAPESFQADGHATGGPFVVFEVTNQPQDIGVDVVRISCVDQHVTSRRHIVERLRQEHLVVHELLKRLEEAADKLINDTSTSNFDEITEIFEQLHKVVKSHFGYEETELREALGKFAPVI